MNAKLLLPALLISCALSAQEIRQVPVTIEDIQSVLVAAGYNSYSFDISAFEGEDWDLSVVYRIYEHGKKVDGTTLASFTSRKSSSKVLISTLPSPADSLARLYVSVPGVGHGARNLKLYPLVFPQDPRPRYMYQARPFKPSAPDRNATEGFIPLLLYGSGWMEEEIGAIRFCGEREVDPDMSSEILKNLPQYYVFGLKYVKR